MTRARVPNGTCRFGRQHRWLCKGDEIAGQQVAVCSTCLLVCGTGIKATDDLGALYEAERITREFFGVGRLVVAMSTRKIHRAECRFVSEPGSASMPFADAGAVRLLPHCGACKP